MYNDGKAFPTYLDNKLRRKIGKKDEIQLLGIDSVTVDCADGIFFLKKNMSTQRRIHKKKYRVGANWVYNVQFISER